MIYGQQTPPGIYASRMTIYFNFLPLFRRMYLHFIISRGNLIRMTYMTHTTQSYLVALEKIYVWHCFTFFKVIVIILFSIVSTSRGKKVENEKFGYKPVNLMTQKIGRYIKYHLSLYSTYKWRSLGFLEFGTLFW